MMREPVTINGVTRWLAAGESEPSPSHAKEHAMPVLRQEIGDVLRDVRQRQGRTLREVSHKARVSLGYLSEVERGQKEASSELLAAICEALSIPQSTMLREVADRMAMEEALHLPDVPDTVPAEMTHRYAQLAKELPDDFGQLAGSH
ncbi:helix-turn-helix domain-containing protein [Citricoccus muralis]|uniref:Helix-turn-helix transcriptional regulator n=1 Tax=Citricoccus muralis TaxID=169134 RepID=A0ABY8H8X5_9MICC|nr:helix-turn-helix transcriptional regulator [Citricoccus muralis]WFP17616.1 helix-turn-helix transcriptional regulator [Citricoccus muralis]